MPTLKIKNLETGEWEKLPIIKGDPGKDGKDGNDYVLVDSDKEEIANITKPLVETALEPTIKEIKDIAEHAEIIARGRATGYVFDTLEDLESWLQDSNNIANLVVGDNFYIKALNVPDYWWDGEDKQPLETEKPDLTNLVKNTDYATSSKAGLLRPANGLFTSGSTGALLIAKASNAQIDAKTDSYYPIVSSNLDYAVKKALSDSKTEWSDTEKQQARDLLNIEEQLANLLLRAHPIGSYYWSEDSTDPSELFGGTWERVKDKFLYALGDDGAVGDEGGASSVTLTKANLPNYNLYDETHNHTQNPHHHLFSAGGNAISVYADSGVLGGNGFETSSPNTAWSGTNINLTGIAQSTATNQETKITVNSGGNDTPFSIIPTHIKAYCWKRTA